MATEQIAFQLDSELIELIKKKATAQRKSLNRYLELLLLKDVGNIPNDETQKAIAEVMEGKNLEVIDKVDTFMDSI